MYAITMSNVEDIDAGDEPFTTIRRNKEDADELAQKWLDERTMTFRIPGESDNTFTLSGFRDGVQEFAMFEHVVI